MRSHILDFEVRALVHTSANAEVWRAHRGGRDWALKLVGVGEDRARVLRALHEEFALGARLFHPNIVRVEAIHEIDGAFVLVSEWVDGWSAALWPTAAARGSRVPLDAIVKIVLDAAIGLDFAHHAAPGLVHRDVTTQNILVSVDGIARVLDFGLARARGAGSPSTTPGLVSGTPAFMAPEQVLGAEVDARADVWGLGAVLHHMLRGLPPYASTSARAALFKHMTGEPPPPVPAWVPLPLARVVSTALARDKAQRFPTAAHFCNALADAARQLGLTPGPSEVLASVEMLQDAR